VAWWLAGGLVAGGNLREAARVGPLHDRGHKWPHTGQNYP
jgi:hypothetical protein